MWTFEESRDCSRAKRCSWIAAVDLWSLAMMCSRSAVLVPLTARMHIVDDQPDLVPDEFELAFRGVI
jgi:hypothetical protein